MSFKGKKNNDFLSIKIEKLIDWNEPNGEGCIVSDRITKEGFKVGYMYREAPDEDNPDSGWRFLAGNEDEAYMNEVTKHSRSDSFLLPTGSEAPQDAHTPDRRV